MRDLIEDLPVEPITATYRARHGGSRRSRSCSIGSDNAKHAMHLAYLKITVVRCRRVEFGPVAKLHVARQWRIDRSSLYGTQFVGFMSGYYQGNSNIVITHRRRRVAVRVGVVGGPSRKSGSSGESATSGWEDPNLGPSSFR